MLANGVSSSKKQAEANQHQYPEDMWNSICRPLPLFDLLLLIQKYITAKHIFFSPAIPVYHLVSWKNQNKLQFVVKM